MADLQLATSTQIEVVKYVAFLGQIEQLFRVDAHPKRNNFPPCLRIVNNLFLDDIQRAVNAKVREL